MGIDYIGAEASQSGRKNKRRSKNNGKGKGKKRNVATDLCACFGKDSAAMQGTRRNVGIFYVLFAVYWVETWKRAAPLLGILRPCNQRSCPPPPELRPTLI